MRTTGRFILVILMTGVLGGSALTQDLSTSVFPSEDEIYEALRLGEISFEQYLIIQELIVHGLDSTNLHLLDEIPNLSFFMLNRNSFMTSLEKEQQTLFSKPLLRTVETEYKLKGSIKHKYYQYLEENGNSKYQSSIRLTFEKKLTANIKLQREFNGRERVVSRFIRYKSSNSMVREITVGNFSRRFGLGTVFGYRGKLLNFASDLDKESILYPDYGGYNGVYSHIQSERFDIQNLISVNRDTNHRLVSSGIMISYRGKKFTPGLLFGLNQLTNRVSNKSINDIKYGFYTNYKYRNGYNNLEISLQAGEQSALGGIVTEGRHRFNKAEVKYAGWFYSEDYIDLTSGSKAAYIYHKGFLESVDFEYSDKRPGQKGTLIKTIVELHTDFELANSLIYATRNSDSIEVQWFTELTRSFNRNFSISLDYLTKIKRRHKINNDYENIKRQTKAEVKFNTDKLYLRSYIGYNSETANRDFWSVLTNLKYQSDSYGLVEIWLNLARIDLSAGIINYWYGFIRNDFYLIDNLRTSIKFSHTYYRESKNRHQTLVSFEVNYLL